MIHPMLIDGLDQPEGPAFLSDGRLFVVEMGEGRACVSEIVAGARREIVRPGGRPTGLAVDGDDCLWVAGARDNCLVRMTPDGDELVRIAGDEDGSFFFPNDLAFGPDGLLYMTDSGIRPEHFIVGRAIRPDFASIGYAGSVFQIDPVRGEVLRRLDTGIRFANGLAFDASGALHVAETISGLVFRYEVDRAASREVFSQTMLAADARRFAGPDGMAFDTAGNLHCALYGCGEISVSAPDGHVVRRLPTAGLLPTNLAFVPQESAIVVTEVETGSLQTIAVDDGGLPLHRPSLT